MFHSRFPEIAKKETRCFVIPNSASTVLPPGEYGLLEMYCDEPGCDCRRVMLAVLCSETKQELAFITYGWGTAQFYAKWFGHDDPEGIEEMQGVKLNMCSAQSKYASVILDLVKNQVLSDTNYIKRLQRHYELFRSSL